jgi:hypothetical protein
MGYRIYPMTHAPWRNKRRANGRAGDHCLTVAPTNEGVPSAGPVRSISPEAVWDAPRAIMHCLKKSGLTSAGELALSRVICSQIALASTDCRGGAVAQLARTLAVITSSASRTFPTLLRSFARLLVRRSGLVRTIARNVAQNLYEPQRLFDGTTLFLRLATRPPRRERRPRR